jgi:uncharacterized repeat protein (TIGR03803 family)
VVGAARWLSATTAITLPAQTFITLHSFDGTDGANPLAAMLQASNGNLYGTTDYGGANSTDAACGGGCGTVFKITPSGTLSTIYSFCSQSGCTDGAHPYARLVQGTDGNFYGTTVYGGASESCSVGWGCGTIFKISPSGTLTTLHSLDENTDGVGASGLILSIDGNFYGTAGGGGVSGHGTVFKITPSGRLTTLYSFCSQTACTDGSEPMSGLVQATDGNFYGTTFYGGANDNGTVFRITPSGTLTTLHSFDSTDGSNPPAGVVQATDGNLFGITQFGGAKRYGTVFEITTGGALTTLYSFCSQSSCTDDQIPYAELVQGTDDNFYGTTSPGRGQFRLRGLSGLWHGLQNHPQAACLRRCTASTPRTAPTPSRRWFRTPMGRSMEQRRLAGPAARARVGVARSSACL